MSKKSWPGLYRKSLYQMGQVSSRTFCKVLDAHFMQAFRFTAFLGLLNVAVERLWLGLAEGMRAWTHQRIYQGLGTCFFRIWIFFLVLILYYFDFNNNDIKCMIFYEMRILLIK